MAFCLCAVGSEGGSGDSSPETALLAALARGQTSCSVSCIIRLFLEVSEISRTDSLLIVVLSRSAGFAVSPEKNG